MEPRCTRDTDMSGLRTQALLLVFVLSAVCAGGCENVFTHYDVSVNWYADQSAIKSVAVVEFDWTRPVAERPPEGWSYGHLLNADVVVADAIASSLTKLDRYNLKDRSELRRVAEDHDLQLSEILAKGQYARIGQLVDVDALVVGNVYGASFVQKGSLIMIEIAFYCRCVSTRNADVYWSIGGTKTVRFAQRIGPWVSLFSDELIARLKKELEHPPKRISKPPEAANRRQAPPGGV